MPGAASAVQPQPRNGLRCGGGGGRIALIRVQPPGADLSNAGAALLATAAAAKRAPPERDLALGPAEQRAAS